MNLSHNMRRNIRLARREPATHLYAIGETVRMKGSFAKTADIYHITARLPAKGDELQYRIRNDDERHERVTTQGNLEAIGSLPTSKTETLIERTFGHSQRTKV
jgi:hypothetical protein